MALVFVLLNQFVSGVHAYFAWCAVPLLDFSTEYAATMRGELFFYVVCMVLAGLHRSVKRATIAHRSMAADIWRITVNHVIVFI